MTRFMTSTALGFVAVFGAGAASAQAPAATSAPAATATTAAPATAAPAEIAVGQTVKDDKGGTVGTVEAVDAENVTVATSKVKVKVPVASFAKTPDGPVIAMTAAQLDAAAGAAGAAATAGTTGQAATKLAQGANVTDPKGGKVGTVAEVSGEFVTVATAKNKARLPKTAFADGSDGVVIAMTEAELDATVEAAKPKSASR